MRRGGLGVRWCLVLVMLLGLLVSVPQTVRAADGDIWSWGDNSVGQLGNGSAVNETVPIHAPTQLANVVQVAGGEYFSMALLADGTVWSWGENTDGQLGNGTFIDSGVPVHVVGPSGGDTVLSGITAISSGQSSAFALSEDGTVYAWGNNTVGQLGDNTFENSNIPVEVSGVLSGVTIIDIASGGAHALALAADGTVYAWGFDWFGQVGIGDFHVTTQEPVEVTTLSAIPSRIVNVASGPFALSSMAIAEDGTLYQWGVNLFKLNPDVETDHWLFPVIVDGISNVIDAAAGTYHGQALTASGDVYAWGRTAFTGTGAADTLVLEPQLVMTDVTAIAAGSEFGLALKDDATLYSWGANDAAQLGDGTTNSRPTPVAVATSMTFDAIAAGAYHALAIEWGPPITTATVNDQPPHDGWYQFATVTLTSNDPEAATTFEINGGATQPYVTPFALTPDGIFTITFRSVDTVNNVEADQILTVKVDSTSPSVQPVDNQTLNPTSTVGAPVTFVLDVFDTFTATTDLTILCLDQDDKPFADGDTAPIGITTISCTVTDLAGNADSVSFTVTVRGVDGAFDVLQAQIAELEIPRIMRMSLHAQVRMAERMAEADRVPLSCLQLRVLDLSIQILKWVRVVDTQDASDIREQMQLIRDFLDC